MFCARHVFGLACCRDKRVLVSSIRMCHRGGDKKKGHPPPKRRTATVRERTVDMKGQLFKFAWVADVNCSTRFANALFLSTLLVTANLVSFGLFTRTAAADTTVQEWKQALNSRQSTIRSSVFGTAYTNEFIRLSLQERPEEFQQTAGFGPVGEP